MNLIRQKVFSVLTEAAYNQIDALDLQSPHTKELNEEDINAIINEELEKMCNAATMGEITKTLLLVRRLKKAPVHKREIIISELKSIAEKLITRVETKSGSLKLSDACVHLFSEI